MSAGPFQLGSLLLSHKILITFPISLLCISSHSEFYEPNALMMEEEGAIIAGLLVGLNVIDANFCMKGEDLDSQVLVVHLMGLFCSFKLEKCINFA